MAQVTTVVAVPVGAATQLFAPDGGRLDALVTNTGAVAVYLGNDATTGPAGPDIVRLRVGEEFPFHDSTLSLYAAVLDPAGGSVTTLVTNDQL